MIVKIKENMTLKENVDRLIDIETERNSLMTVLKDLKFENIFEILRRIRELNIEHSSILGFIDDSLNMTYKIFFIESPSAKDIVDLRTEGKGLLHYFNLAGIDADYYLVKSKNDFKNAFHMISKDVKSRKEQSSEYEVFFPILHFSGHGNEQLFGLTDGSILTWEELGVELYELNIESGIDITKQVSDFIVCLSVCYGSSLKKVITEGNGTPFHVMIGPLEKVDWDDAITAFQTFYHSFIRNKRILSESIEIMKNSSGFEKFEYVTDSRLILTTK